MVRLPCCDESNVKRGPWTPDEDKLLVNYITKNGHGSWRLLSKKAGLNRCGKSCRLRWTNYLRPDIKRGRFDEEEEKLIIHLHSILGNKWSSIATKLPGRTDNEIKNYWNTHLRKKLLSMGIDPVTHKPHTLTASNLGTLVGTSQPIAMEFLRLQLVQILLQSMIATTPSLNPNMNLNSSPIGLNKDQPSNPINPSASSTHEEWFNDSNSEYEQETSVKETETNDPFEALEDLNLDELSSDPYWKSII